MSFTLFPKMVQLWNKTKKDKEIFSLNSSLTNTRAQQHKEDHFFLGCNAGTHYFH